MHRASLPIVSEQGNIMGGALKIKEDQSKE